MAKHKQEPVDDWMQDARDMAKAERELGIEKWVFITIGYNDRPGEIVKLYCFDFPRELYERRRWVVRWRLARLQCEHPRKDVSTYFSYYDKRTGLKTDFNSCISKLTSAKAQVTKAKRSEEKYVASQKEKYPLFYDEATDTELIKFREKLANKEKNLKAAEESIRIAVERHWDRQGGTPKQLRVIRSGPFDKRFDFAAQAPQ